MNTPEKYVTAYIVESLTGIKGSNPERVYEVLRESDFTIDDPFLNLVYQMARLNPDSQGTKEAVAGLVIGHTLFVNKPIASAFEESMEEYAAKEVEKALAKQDEPKDGVTLEYEIFEGTMYSDIRCVKNGKTVITSSMQVPEQYADYVLTRFSEKFPDGKIVKSEQ